MPKEGQNIAIVGSGNVAWHLANMFNQKAISFTIISRSGSLDSAFSDFENATWQNYSQVNWSDYDLIFLSVSDDNISKVSKEVFEVNAEAKQIHLSGAKNINDLVSSKRGVFYMFQTFSKERELSENNFRVFIEASNDALNAELIELAKSLGKEFQHLSSESRLNLHVSGVLGNNFVNAVLSSAREYLETQNINSQVLIPLVKETLVKNFSSDNPWQTQTGPAVRADEGSINKHLNLLQDQSDLQKLYRTLSDYIMQHKK